MLAVWLFGFRRVRAAVPWSLDSSVAQITKPRYQVKQQSTDGPRNVPPRTWAVWLFPRVSNLEHLACCGEFNLDRILGGFRCLHTPNGNCLGLSREFAVPLVVGCRGAARRLAELRDRDIGSLALGDTFGPNFGGFRRR